jgi:hypothetical protein
MERKIRALTLAFTLIAFAAFFGESIALSAQPSAAWRTEFDDICARTNDTDSMSKEELKSLIERCDKLKPELENLDPSARKLWTKRLQLCRDLFAYVLETKEQQGDAASAQK